ncbi:cysteine--tRNA ligase, partial [Patescibacteria group bacterium]|nr:cysteine--tRNA ligase [Patescibacteria group bacterium]
PEKKSPWDFLLWVTNQPNHIMQWDSPWDKGFPGWHIECTAMSIKYLGKKFDIHTGGKEHIPVHHTNEIAQTFGAFSDQAVNYWLHNEWLSIDNQKVSKSLGNVILVQDFEEPLAFRYLALTSYYRQGLNFSRQALIASQNALNSLRDKFQECKKSKEKVRKGMVCKNKEQFLSLLENDLGFPQGLAFLWQIVKDKNINNAEKYLLLKEADIIFSFDLGKKQTVPSEIHKMAKDRQKAREQKDWQKSDQIRNDIEKQGYIVEDSGKQFLIKRK